jgi:hypothetical protein
MTKSMDHGLLSAAGKHPVEVGGVGMQMTRHGVKNGTYAF